MVEQVVIAMLKAKSALQVEHHLPLFGTHLATAGFDGHVFLVPKNPSS